ncbi:hypothetical protein RFI_25396, partial [Reticulomyxa filosa]
EFELQIGYCNREYSEDIIGIIEEILSSINPNHNSLKHVIIGYALPGDRYVLNDVQSLRWCQLLRALFYKSNRIQYLALYGIKMTNEDEKLLKLLLQNQFQIVLHGRARSFNQDGYVLTGADHFFSSPI